MRSRHLRIRKLSIVGLTLLGTLLILSVVIPPSTRSPGDSSSGSNASAPSTTVPPIDSSTTTTSTTSTTSTSTTTTTTTEPPYDGWVDPETSGTAWGDSVDGLLTFRGNPTRSFYGKGPIPEQPEVIWRFPENAMCSQSSTGGEVFTWCGTGWTGQPSIFEHEGRTWTAFGAYSRDVHVLDADTGERILPDFPTGDIIKGSVTIDPDGFPLLYTGSRDNFFRVIALDREEQTELWKLSAFDVSPTLWNNDWDGAGLIIDDHLFIGGENSQFHIVKLNRGYDTAGLVTVDPELIFNTPGWDDELIAAVGRNVSIENSVAISGNTVYFANSGGLVQGWDISGLADGIEPTRVFRYWAGDDIDASIVIDDEGMLYLGVEYERGTARSRTEGQVIKLDPTNADDPRVWGVDARPRLDSGVWATPGLVGDLLIVPTDTGEVLGIDRFTGDVRWRKKLPGPTWSSPVIVDDVWIEGDCAGVLHGFDVSDTTVEPPELWSVTLGGCIESTPGVWGGHIIVGTRAGYVYGLG